MGASETWGLIIRPLFFLLCIKFLSKIMSGKSNLLWFADDMSIIITNSDLLAFRNNIDEVFMEINGFQVSQFSLNYYKTFFLHFGTK
jgi:hypothetical protein